MRKPVGICVVPGKRNARDPLDSRATLYVACDDGAVFVRVVGGVVGDRGWTETSPILGSRRDAELAHNADPPEVPLPLAIQDLIRSSGLAHMGDILEECCYALRTGGAPWSEIERWLEVRTGRG